MPNDFDPRRFLEERNADLRAALARAEAQGLRAGCVPVEHVRAFLTERLGEEFGNDSRGSEDVLNHWSVLTSGLAEERGAILSDLVWSLAMERRAEWRSSSAREEDASDALSLAIVRHEPYLLGALRKRLPSRAAAVEEAVLDAWARAFATYWAESATRRFAGRSRLFTLVFTIAYRELGHASRSGAQLEALDASHEHLADRGAGPVAAAAALELDLSVALRDCIDELPEKRRVVAELRFGQGLKPSEVAEAVNTTRPNVANHLKLARESLRDCLGAKGVDVPGEIAGSEVNSPRETPRSTEEDPLAPGEDPS